MILPTLSSIAIGSPRTQPKPSPLVLVREALIWLIERRGQRGDHADWFLRDPDDNAVAFEVSGIDAGDHEARLRLKLGQVGRSLADRRAACVVELATPVAALATEAAPAR